MKIGDKVVYCGTAHENLIGKLVTIVEAEENYNDMGAVYKVSFGSETTWVYGGSIKPYTNDVTKPSHYHQGGIDIIGFSLQNYTKEQIKGFYRINIMKYIHRYDFKNGKEDLIKAKDYLERLIELEGKENGEN